MAMCCILIVNIIIVVHTAQNHICLGQTLQIQRYKHRQIKGPRPLRIAHRASCTPVKKKDKLPRLHGN